MQIYTDGACKGNPGRGGWGVVVVSEEVIINELSGCEKHTTNNRMELTAAIMGVDAGVLFDNIHVFTDSTYVRNGITTWINKWRTNNWMTSNKQPVKNRDLWMRLDELCNKTKVRWSWIKGHSKNKFNDKADKLASNAASIT